MDKSTGFGNRNDNGFPFFDITTHIGVMYSCKCFRCMFKHRLLLINNFNRCDSKQNEKLYRR